MTKTTDYFKQISPDPGDGFICLLISPDPDDGFVEGGLDGEGLVGAAAAGGGQPTLALRLQFESHLFQLLSQASVRKRIISRNEKS
jgi:hypothetical protein